MKRIRSLNSRRVLSAVTEPLKSKGVVIQPGGDAEKAIRSGVKVANEGIRALNRLLAEGEQIVEEGRAKVHQATAPKSSSRKKR